MKHQKKIKALITILLVTCITFCMTTTGFSATGNSPAQTPVSVEVASPETVIMTEISFVRTSSTKGLATVHATSSSPNTPYVKSKITLQEAPLNSKNYVNSDVTPASKTVSTYSILHEASFAISTTKNYRIRVDLTDNYNGIDSTSTTYVALQ